MTLYDLHPDAKIGQNAVVAHHTVMGHMHIGHQQVVVSDNGLAAGGGATVDGAALTDAVIVTYLNGGVFACKLQVLWDCGDDSTRENFAVLADAGTGEDGHIGTNPSSVANLHVLIDGGEIRNLYVLANFGIRMKVV